MSSFAINSGLMLATMAFAAAWLFRTASTTPLIKIAASALVVACACYFPSVANGIAGRPVSSNLSALPGCFTIDALFAKDEANLVDLWIDEGGTPRAYELPVDPGMHDALAAAADRLAGGERPRLCKGEKSKGEGARAHNSRSDLSGSGGLTIDSPRSLKDLKETK